MVALGSQRVSSKHHVKPRQDPYTETHDTQYPREARNIRNELLVIAVLGFQPNVKIPDRIE